MLIDLRKKSFRITSLGVWLLASTLTLSAQGMKAKDPGVRQGGPGAGGSLKGLSVDYQALFTAGLNEFVKQDKVVDDGLGPRMNLDSCAGCHAAPAVGGTSPELNPQFAFVNGADHGVNKLPSFITKNGPTREARFKLVSGSTKATDGGVHDLFVISGMAGATGCVLEQPDFATELGRNNVIFRIPTPVFGGGLIEQIPDTAIVNNLSSESSAAAKKRLGIGGRVNIVVSGNTRTEQGRIRGEANRNGNDGTIARFGWKAQNKSLLLFAGEAYNVEMGISNELFQTEREENAGCQFHTTPNDTTNAGTAGVGLLSDIEIFALFMRLLAPPEPSVTEPGGAPSITRGRQFFTQVGCAFCHTPTLQTGNSTIPQLRNQPVNLWSDLAIHQMGPNLDDGVSQGQAAGNEFRTAPLWGVGQRHFFLHDGRTNDLLVAIQQHQSGNGKKASEANQVVHQFDRLHENEKQDVLNFLRSL